MVAAARAGTSARGGCLGRARERRLNLAHADGKQSGFDLRFQILGLVGGQLGLAPLARSLVTVNKIVPGWVP